MSSIKPKIGKCKDCPAGAAAKPLTAGRCQQHYWEYRNKVNSQKPAAKAKKAKKASLNVFFASEILTTPNKCEECGGDLRYWRQSKVFARALIAHILPKREKGGFPTVATHPKNKMYFCPDCHTNYDNKGADYAAKMQSLPVMRERFNEFKHLLSESDLQRVPNYLK